jgi:putative serine protease PepD
MTAVAILAAALASGGTFAATRYAAPAPAASPAATTQSNGSTSPQVIQGNASAPDWTATAKAVAPSVVSIAVTSGQAEGQGSGVIIDGQGHILTNNHVATGAGANATISVTLNDGRTYDAKIVGTDPSTDLAVLLLNNPPSDLVPMSIGDSSQVVVGQPVMAIGNPLGLSGTVTTGIVSALDRPVTTQAAESPQGQQGQGLIPGTQQQPSVSDQVVTNAIQTSAAINPGNSGGALVTADGKLIGINSSIASLGASAGGQSGNIGIGFAIPVNEAKSIADQLISTGTAQHAYIGVSAGDTTVTDGSSKRQAALVQTVAEGTPAAQAGLQAKDAVIAIDGKPIDSSEALVANIHEHKVGDTVTVTIIRGSQKQDLTITLAARPG